MATPTRISTLSTPAMASPKTHPMTRSIAPAHVRGAARAAPLADEEGLAGAEPLLLTGIPWGRRAAASALPLALREVGDYRKRPALAGLRAPAMPGGAR
jgi:hypothetical protein